MTVIVDTLPMSAFDAPTEEERTCAVDTTYTFELTVCVLPYEKVCPFTVDVATLYPEDAENEIFSLSFLYIVAPFPITPVDAPEYPACVLSTVIELFVPALMLSVYVA